MSEILCSICARGGSKGVKNKNLKIIFDKPLIAHTIAQAKKTDLFKHIVVSSDSQEILDVAKKNGADYTILRPTELASDTSAKIPAIRHCAQETEKLTKIKYDIFVDLDCTSPLRLPEDILNSVELLKKTKAQNIITGAPAHRSPYFNLVEINNDGLVSLAKKLEKPIARRQDAPLCYDMNASIYVWQREALLKFESVILENTRIYVMPPERSLDIDSELDFDIVEFIAKKRGFLS